MVAASVLLATATAHAGEERPRIDVERAEEDWSPLADPALRTGFWDPVKYVALGAGRHPFLSIGGELRARFEAVEDPRLGFAVPDSDAYLLQRALLHADLRLSPAFRLFVQAGSYLAHDKDLPIGSADEDELDLAQAFLELETALVEGRLRLRGGRQEMKQGVQRFVALRDASNIRQAFDGMRVTWTEPEGVRLDAFAFRPVEIRRGNFDNRADPAVDFAGIYASHPLLPGALAGDAYVYWLADDDASYGDVTGGERRASLGMRLWGADAGYDYDWELVYQMGDHADRDIGAFGLGSGTGYTLAALAWRPRLGLQLDLGSGDADAGDGRLNTFNPLFPQGSYFSQGGLSSFGNLVGVYPSVRLEPLASLTIDLGVQFKWRWSEEDAVYLQPLSPVPGTAAVDGRYVGELFNLEATWRFDEQVTLRAAWNYHTTGEVLERAGAECTQFFMAVLGWRF
jgi:hypothetical protein